MRIVTPMILTIAVGLISACGTARSYRLPLAAASARATFAPIVAVANEMGLPTVEHRDAIDIQLDTTARVQFMIQDEQFKMVIIVDHHAVPPGELDQCYSAAKNKADEIWKKALAGMQNRAAPSSNPDPNPG